MNCDRCKVEIRDGQTYCKWEGMPVCFPCFSRLENKKITFPNGSEVHFCSGPTDDRWKGE